MLGFSPLSGAAIADDAAPSVEPVGSTTSAFLLNGALGSLVLGATKPGASIPVSVTVSVTGVEATGAVGSVTVVIPDVDVPVTGVAATGQTGTLAATGTANVSPTGVEGTGQVGTVDAIVGGATVFPTGVAATGQTGVVVEAGNALVFLTGVSATGQTGSPTVTGTANVSPTGVEGTGAVGTVQVGLGKTVSIIGVDDTPGSVTSFYKAINRGNPVETNASIDPSGNGQLVQFLNNGSLLYVTSGTAVPKAYSLSTPWDITTATQLGPGYVINYPSSFNIRGQSLSDDGLYLYVVIDDPTTNAHYFRSYSLNTPYDTYSSPDFYTLFTDDTITNLLPNYSTEDIYTARRHGNYIYAALNDADSIRRYVYGTGSFVDFPAPGRSFHPDSSFNFLTEDGQDYLYFAGYKYSIPDMTLVEDAGSPTFFFDYGTDLKSDGTAIYAGDTFGELNRYNIIQTLAQVGDAGAVGTANVFPTGVEGTGQIGDPVVTGDAVVTPTGVEGTGQTGTVQVLINDTIVAVTGVEATGQTGTVAVTGDAVVTPTGVTATGQTGTPTVTGTANVSLTGVQGSGAVGTVTAVIGGAIATPTGVEATGQAGTPTVTGTANVSLTGVQGTSAVGTVTVSVEEQVTVAVTGVEATGAVGTATVSTATNVVVFPTGVAATGQVGTPTVTGTANVAPTGVEATGVVGNATAGELTLVEVTGVSATGAVGNVTLPRSVVVEVSGVRAFGRVGSFLFWSRIVPEPGTSYSDIDLPAEDIWTEGAA